MINPVILINQLQKMLQWEKMEDDGEGMDEDNFSFM